MNKPSIPLATVMLTVACTLALSACGDKPATGQADKPANARPAVPVSTVEAVRRDMERSLDARHCQRSRSGHRSPA